MGISVPRTSGAGVRPWIGSFAEAWEGRFTRESIGSRKKARRAANKRARISRKRNRV